MKIGIITVEDLNNKKAWSGIVYKVYDELCTRYGKENIVHCQTRIDFPGKIYLWGYSYISRLFGKGFSPMTRFISKRMASTIPTKKLGSIDVIFAPAGSVDIAYIKTDTPIIYYSDATFRLLNNYYFKKLFKNKEREAYEIEKLALNKSSYLLFASHWAMQSAILDYDISTLKASVVEFGANIDDKDINFRRRIKVLNNNEPKKLKVLFIGVDWIRKGGAIAVECCSSLKKRGFDIELHIVGIPHLPPEYAKCDIIVNHGFLNKNKQNDYLLLTSIIDECDIFLLPTRAECAGIVFAEASAFGLPIVTYDTGGVSNYVINGLNGYRLPMNCKGKDFADKIETILMKDELEKLSIGGRQLYEERLNWEHWGKEFDRILKKVVK